MKLLTRTAVTDRRYSKFVRPESLPDGAFHLELDQSFKLDTVFHGELADEIVDETIHAQAHRLRLAQTSLLHVKNLFCANLADTGFVLHGVAGSSNRNCRVSVGS